MAAMSKSMFVGTKEAECNEKNTCPAVEGVDSSCFTVVLQLKMKGEWLLQADNDPKCTSSSAMVSLKRNKGKVLPWLSVFCLKSVA